VLEARGGVDALTIWNDHAESVDVLLSDIRMPELDGHELAARLVAHNPLLPVVLMSADAGDEMSGSRQPSRGHYIVSKPFKLSALLSTLRRALDTVPDANVA
jgi:two-component system, cell cycle sensor histidine kinase and response regulator CckA